MSLIAYAMRMAKEYYDDKTYDHVARVAQYVAENDMIPSDKMDECIALAWMHDLLEDTEYVINNNLDLYFKECIKMITKLKEQDYIEYIKNIREHAHSCEYAYWVKLADMKDHLAQTETLTDKLREKYLAALPYLS